MVTQFQENPAKVATSWSSQAPTTITEVIKQIRDWSASQEGSVICKWFGTFRHDKSLVEWFAQQDPEGDIDHELSIARRVFQMLIDLSKWLG